VLELLVPASGWTKFFFSTSGGKSYLSISLYEVTCPHHCTNLETHLWDETITCFSNV